MATLLFSVLERLGVKRKNILLPITNVVYCLNTLNLLNCTLHRPGIIRVKREKIKTMTVNFRDLQSEG